VKNAKMIGSLLLGTVCRRKMLAEGFSELVHKCPMCHSVLSDKHILSVKEGHVVLEPTVRRRSLDEFSEVSDKLLPVEVVQDEEREGKGNDGKTADSGTDEGRRRNGAENVDGARRADGETKDTEEVHRDDEGRREPPEDA